MLRRGHGRVTIFHFRNTRISKENSWWSKVGKVITHFSSRRVARIPPPPEVTAPFRRHSNDPGRSCGRGNGDGEGSGARGGGRGGGGWRAPPRATGPGAGAAHCWALRGAATRRARAGRRSRSRRRTRAGGVRGRVHLQGPACAAGRGVRGRVHLQGPACAAGRDRGRVCASDSGAPDKARSWRGPPRPPHEASTPVRGDQAVGRRAESPTRRTPASGPIAHRYRSAAERCSNHPERHRAPAARTNKPPPASPAPATGSNDSYNTPCTCTCTT